jgi:arylsulfatase A-like enzyme
LGKEHERMLNENPTPDGYFGRIWDEQVKPAIGQSDQPFFLYYHELDPHGPYLPRPPFDTMYPNPYPGRPELEADNINLVRLGLTELSKADIKHLETNYRGEVSFVDGVLGALVDRLEAEGLAENTVLIVTSDHGEEFGEHGGIGHMVTLYDEVLRVPLIWAWPGHVHTARDTAYTGLIDLTPTLLGLLGCKIPDGMEGRDLSSHLTSDARATPYPILGHLTGKRDRVQRAINWAGWKLVEREYGAESEYELFNTRAEPEEITNLWTSERETGLALRQRLEWSDIISGDSAADTEAVEMESVDPELVERLRNLGYVE